MKKIKERILELSDMIHEDDMEYSMYTREEFIKELDQNVTSFLAAKSYLEAMGEECDKLFDEKDNSSYLSVKEDIRLFLYTIQEDILKEQKEKFWKKKMEQISIGDIFFNYIGEQGSVKFYMVVEKKEKTIKCQELETIATKKIPKYAKPGEPIKDRFYIMKNETIHGEWCCPYTKSEPVSFYLTENPYKNNK